MKVRSKSEVAQSCPTLSNPMDCSLPGSSVHGIFQAKVLEWGAIAFSVFPKHNIFISKKYSRVINKKCSCSKTTVGRKYMEIKVYCNKNHVIFDILNNMSVSHSVMSDSLQPHGL